MSSYCDCCDTDVSWYESHLDTTGGAVLTLAQAMALIEAWGDDWTEDADAETLVMLSQESYARRQS